MFIDPTAELGETMLPVMLSPPLPANENPPLATTGGGASVVEWPAMVVDGGHDAIVGRLGASHCRYFPDSFVRVDM